MTRDAITAKITELMEDIFDEDDLTYSDALTAADIEEWDSLSNIRFVVGIEKEFASVTAKSPRSRMSARWSISLPPSSAERGGDDTRHAT